MSTVRILLVDDFAPFLSYVRNVLAEYPEFDVIGEAADGLEALEKAKALQPSLILLDIGLPKLDGIQVATQLRTIAPLCRVLFLTAHSSRDMVPLALSIGALGYVSKWSAVRDLVPAVKAVCSGNQFVSRRFASCDLPDPIKLQTRL